MRKKLSTALLILLAIFVIEARHEPAPVSVQNAMVVYRTYVPTVFAPKLWIGVETEGNLLSQFYDFGNIKASIRWSDVEATEGIYDWTFYDQKIGTLPDVQTYGSIKMAPPWSNQNQPVCKLPIPQYWSDFVDFSSAAISRYQFDYVGIWNEPDALPTDPSHYNYYGCVGDGEAYGEFFAYVYQELKPIYPNVTFVIGDTMNYNSDFVADMLIAVGDNYDAIGFHCYAQWYSTVMVSDCTARIDYFDSLTDKPILLTESAVMCYGNCGPAFEDAQITHFLSMVYDGRLQSFYWYTLGCNEWMETDMVDNCERPRKVWYIYGNIAGGS